MFCMHYFTNFSHSTAKFIVLSWAWIYYFNFFVYFTSLKTAVIDENIKN